VEKLGRLSDYLTNAEMYQENPTFHFWDIAAEIFSKDYSFLFTSVSGWYSLSNMSETSDMAPNV
jgi:hypothetical protein